MRSLFQFIVIVALAVCGYFLYPVVAQFLRGHGSLPPETAVVVVPSVQPAPVPSPAPPPGTPVAPVPVPDPGPKPTPVPAAGTGNASMPRYKTLEEITDDWKNVPAKAFPKRVAVKAEVQLATPTGDTMKVSEGGEVVPLALTAEGMLTVSSGEASEMKAVVPVDQTDFKDRVTKRYNDGMEKIRNEAVARQQAERERLAAAGSTSETVKSQAGETPRTSTDEERYLALMRESVASGGLQGVSADKVKAWRWIGYEEIEGIGYWTGAAVVTKQTYFGEFETEAKALIRNGKVERWVLPGVGE